MYIQGDWIPLCLVIYSIVLAPAARNLVSYLLSPTIAMHSFSYILTKVSANHASRNWLLESLGKVMEF